MEPMIKNYDVLQKKKLTGVFLLLCNSLQWHASEVLG